eukprot:scaffold284006_cov21-Tisochrysis_lutea.AAC.1
MFLRAPLGRVFECERGRRFTRREPWVSKPRTCKLDEEEGAEERRESSEWRIDVARRVRGEQSSLRSETKHRCSRLQAPTTPTFPAPSGLRADPRRGEKPRRRSDVLTG